MRSSSARIGCVEMALAGDEVEGEPEVEREWENATNVSMLLLRLPRDEGDGAGERRWYGWSSDIAKAGCNAL